MAQARAAWMAGQSQLELNRLVFIDEAGAKTNMTRLYGRAEKGARVVDGAPHGHGCTTTRLASIRLNGTTACMAIDGSTTGNVFRAYTEHVLVPSLRRGDIVVLDHLASHKDPTARELIRQAGADVRLLPPYSPALNPIEKMWSKIKQILRSIKARTRETLLAASATALECVSPEDALGWLASCG